MPRKDAPEFSYDPKTKLYRKRVKDEFNNRWVPVYGHTKQELRQKIEIKKEQLKISAAREGMPLVYEYAQKWYKLNAPGKVAKTQQNFRTTINRYICPVIGSLPLNEVTTDDVKSVMASLAGYSHETQKRTLNIMRRIFTAAVDSHYIKESPVKGIKAEGKPTAEKVPYTKEQQAALMKALEETRCKVFCALCLYAGLRREEALGLMWECVHLDAPVPYLEVRRSCKWETNAPIVSEDLKSAAARRDIPLPPALVSILDTEKKKNRGSFVVCTQNGTALSLSAFRRMWGQIESRSERTFTYKVNGKEYTVQLHVGDRVPYSRVLVGIDFEVQPHRLRHTYITELILAGANIKKVQYLAGHSDVNVTLKIYAHLLENRPESTQDAVLMAFGANS